MPQSWTGSEILWHADMSLERMESNIMAVLRHDMECIAAIHCLKVYCQRLGCDLSDGAAVRRAAGCAFALATEALSDMAILQFPPSLTAAAILVAARRAQASPAMSPCQHQDLQCIEMHSATNGGHFCRARALQPPVHTAYVCNHEVACL